MRWPKLSVRLTILICLVITVPIWGQESYASLDSLINAAEQGDDESQYVLGHKYFSGDGVSQDYTEAAKWFLKAAEQGHIEAQYYLGTFYRDGNGVPQYYLDAAKWCRKAAEQDYSAAQNMLGDLYYNGLGVAQDNKEAVRWYRQAAEQGYGDAQNNLGTMYADGLGAPRDYIQAHMWFNLSSTISKGKLREEAANNRDSVAILMTDEQISTAQKLAREWMEKHKNMDTE